MQKSTIGINSMGKREEVKKPKVDSYMWAKFVDYECDTIFKGRLE